MTKKNIDQNIRNTDSKLRFWLRVVWLIAYVLMVVSMLNSLSRLNTDAIAYMRIAEYWAAGNFELAVTGYWGPLLSLLMVPFLWLGVDPLISGKLAMLISAIVFFHGSQFLVRSVGLRLLDQITVAAVLAIVLPSWMMQQITPDLLVSGLAIYAIGFGVSPEWLTNRRLAMSSGAFWGLAYLAKAVAFPFGIITSFFLGLFWRFSNDKNRQLAWSQTSISIGLFLAISIPLIITISGKYGHVNFSTSGAIAHAIVGPGNEQPAPHPFGNTVYKPESGRVTAWEDPSEMQYEYWSPFESNENFFYQLYLIYRNAKTVFKFFSAFDGIGLFLGWFGIGTFVFGLAFFCKRPRAKTWFNERWRWLNIPVICLGAIYLPVYVLSTDQRYFYLILPLFLILSLGLCRSHNLNGSFIKITIASLFILPTVLKSQSEDVVGPLAKELALRMKNAGLNSPIVGSTFFTDEGHRLGLYVAWHLDQPWHGDVWDFDQVSNLSNSQQNKFKSEAYRNSGAKFTIAINNSKWATHLESESKFKNVTDVLGEQGIFQVYEILK